MPRMQNSGSKNDNLQTHNKVPSMADLNHSNSQKINSQLNDLGTRSAQKDMSPMSRPQIKEDLRRMYNQRKAPEN